MIASEKLKSFVDRIVDLEREKSEVQSEITAIYHEVSTSGFVPKIVRRIVKLSMVSAEQREEEEALLDVYKAALGMLNGTPLGQAAVRRLTTRPKPPAEHDPGQGDIEDVTGRPDAAEEAIEEAAKPVFVSELDIQNARTAGRRAAEAGMAVTDNEFPAHDPRRAAWDEGWCQAAGSDGMEIPDAFRRKPKAQPEIHAKAAAPEEPAAEPAPVSEDEPRITNGDPISKPKAKKKKASVSAKPAKKSAPKAAKPKAKGKGKNHDHRPHA